ncbi:HTH domain-containing protein [Candidatus Woesearchaeota archaeon]|nr:HTH domain-containing protein [Candidatus Woesearchaeota archaeon]
MGQQEVSDFLKKHRTKWFTSKEIAKNLKVSTGSVINNLSKLRKSKQVLFKKAGRANQYIYKYKA